MSIPSPSPSPIPLVPPPTPGDDFVSSDTAIKNKDPHTSPQPGLGAPQQQPRSGVIKDEWMQSVDKLHGELKQLREEMSQLLLDIKKIIGDHDLEKQFEPVAAALDKFTGDIGELSRSLDKTGEVIRKVDLGGLDGAAKKKAEEVLGRVKHVLSRANDSGLASLSQNSQPTLSSSSAQGKSSPAPKRRQQVDNAQLLDTIKQLQDQLAKSQKDSQERSKVSDEKLSDLLRNDRKLKKDIKGLQAQLQNQQTSDVKKPEQLEPTDPATKPSSASEEPTGTEVGKIQPKTEMLDSEIDQIFDELTQYQKTIQAQNSTEESLNSNQFKTKEDVSSALETINQLLEELDIAEGNIKRPSDLSGKNAGNNTYRDEKGAGVLTDKADDSQEIGAADNNSVGEDINKAVSPGGN